MKKVTIKDVAKEAGVSITLVSMALNAKCDSTGNLICNVNKETAKRIKDIANKMGYVPNRAASILRSGKSHSIGVIISDIANKFFSDIAKYIENIAHDNNYMVFFGSSDEKPDKTEHLINAFINSGVDGLIIAPCADSDEIISRAMTQDIPIVLLDRDIKNLNVGRVMLDNHNAGEIGVEHLYERGYRKIEMISYTFAISSMRDREIGYLEAMERHGISNFAKIHYTVYGNAYNDVLKFFKDAIERKVEAIILPTNTLSTYGMTAISELNIKVPEEIAILGFDDCDSFHLFNPTITHIVQSTKILGEESFKILKGMISNDKQDTTCIIKPDIVNGGSTSPIYKDRIIVSESDRKSFYGIDNTNSLYIKAITFKDKGGWIEEKQFMNYSNDGYLLAHGLGQCVKDASSEINIPSDGLYKIFIKTKAWASYWEKEKTIGSFNIHIDNVVISGNTEKLNPEWHWEYAGEAYLDKGKHILKLHDLDGLDGRVESLFITRNNISAKELDNNSMYLKKRLIETGKQLSPVHSYDIIIAGNSYSGIISALIASKNGLKVALVYNGNERVDEEKNIYELLCLLLKHDIVSYKEIGDNLFTFEKLLSLCKENNVAIFDNHILFRADIKENYIEAVVIKDYYTECCTTIKAPYFVDCTNNSELGDICGAKLNSIVNVRSDYEEPSAPENTDINGMTGYLATVCCKIESNSNDSFPNIPCESSKVSKAVHDLAGNESSWLIGVNCIDNTYNAEKIRDYGLYNAYSIWSGMKNSAQYKKKYNDKRLAYVSNFLSQNVNRHIIGDVVLKEQDILNNTQYTDSIVPLCINNDASTPVNRTYLAPIRCFVSRSIDNLFMAGNNISMTSLAQSKLSNIHNEVMTGKFAALVATFLINDQKGPQKIDGATLKKLKKYTNQNIRIEGNIPVSIFNMI